MSANACDFFLERHLDGSVAARVAMRHSHGEQTYAKLAEVVNRVGNYLLNLGVRPEQRIVLHLKDGPELVYFFLAAIKIGAVAVPVNTFGDIGHLSFFLSDTRAQVLVTHNTSIDKITAIIQSAPFLEHVLYVEDAKWSHESNMLDAFPVNEDDSAFWLYTSGSGGIQKAAMHSHAGMIACARHYPRDVLRINESDRVYSASKMFFAYGLGNSLIFPFSTGASCVLNSERSDPATVITILSEYRPTLFFAVPALYNQLLSSPQVDSALFAGVRMCISAGESLSPVVFDAWYKQTGLPIYDGIGSTEAMHIFCSNRPEANIPGTSGRPVSGYELKIVDDHGTTVAVDGIGQLVVRGETLAKGYWNQRRLNRLTFQGEWLATGDIYQQLADGYFRYVGRQDDVFKSSGLWVSPIEVEQALLSHSSVQEAAVVATKNDIGLTVGKAFVVIKMNADMQGEELLKQQIYDHLKKQLSKYKMPASVEFLSALPKTSTGKIARAELRRVPSKHERMPVPLLN